MKLPRFMSRSVDLKNPAPTVAVSTPHPRTLDAVPERVRQIGMLRGLGYS